MGRLIEKCYLYGSCKCQTAGCVILPDDGCPVYRYFKHLIIKDYETRLKAEKVDMLEEIRAELHLTAEMHDDGDYYLRDEWIDEYFDDYKKDIYGVI